VIKTSKLDRVEPNGQVYFKYGNHSNRSLLLRYGFAIEGNKYEHVWVSFGVAQGVADFPDVLEGLMAKRLSLRRKFKLYAHRFCLDLLLFFRLNSWTFWGERAVADVFRVTSAQRELAILEQVAAVLRESAEVFEEEADLSDPALGYHAYFTAVYHREKRRILQKQLRLLAACTEVFTRLEEGACLAEATDALSKPERILLAHYISSIHV
jgi:hypothetical protein